MVVIQGNQKKEVYSLGVNERLPYETVQKLTQQLEDAALKTESIAAEAVQSQRMLASSTADTLIESFIERSRRTQSERSKNRKAELKEENDRIKEMKAVQGITGDVVLPVFTGEGVVVIHVPQFEQQVSSISRLKF